MSDHAPDGPYVYQPYGVQDVAHWKQGRLWGVGSVDRLATIKGLTKEEANAVLEALLLMRERQEAERLLGPTTGCANPLLDGFPYG